MKKSFAVLLSACLSLVVLNGAFASDPYTHNSDPSAAVPMPASPASCGLLLNAPLVFDFEGPLWIPPATLAAAGAMQSCWSYTPFGTNTFWSVGPPYETRLNTGPVSDHTTGFGNYLVFNGRGISLDSISRIRTPDISLNAVTNPQLEFWYHMYGKDIDSLEVMVKLATGGSWDTLHTITGQQHSSQSDPWTSMSLSLSSYSGATINVQFVGYGAGSEVQMAIDDISIRDSATCKPSTFFRSVSNDDSSVLLDWDPGSGTTFKVEYGKKGFVPGTGTKITVTQPPVRINNLQADTTYVFYLRDDCSASQYSSWTGPLEVNTDCSPVLAPYFEDFEGFGWPIGNLQACWDRFDKLDFKWTTGPPSLSYSQSGPGPNNHTPGGSKFIVADRPNQSGNARSSIISPVIDLSNVNNPELVLWTHMFGLHISAFEIAIDSGDGFILLKQIIGTQQIAKTDPWTEHIFALPGYSGKKVKLKFTGLSSSNYGSLSRIAVDDISIGEAPSCRKPTALNLASRSYTSVSLSWLSGGASNWIIKLKPLGSPDSIFASASNPHDLNQLVPGNEYTIWVRDSCGPGDVSEWSAPLSFKTYCLPDTTPYFQDFEAPQFTVQSSWFYTGSFGPCWERSHEVGTIWQPAPATSFPNNNTPAFDHTTGSGKYAGGSLFLANGTIEYTSFTSPHIDLSNLSNPEMSFWYFLGGLTSYSNHIKLEVNNGSGWQQLVTIYGPQQASPSAPWLEQIVDLSGYVDDTIRLRFKSIGNNVYASTAVGIDDIHIYNDSCLPPSNLTANFVQSTMANLSWTSGGASDWVIKYREEGGSFLYNTTSVNMEYKLGGLLPDTPYEIWVRDSCGTDVSPWHGPLYIRTECLPSQVPYYESFDGSSWTPATGLSDPADISSCWYRTDTLNKVWRPKSGPSFSTLSGPGGARTGTGNYLLFGILNPQAGSNTEEIQSPFIINSGLQQPELNYWYHMYGQQINKLEVFLEMPDDSRILIDSLIGQQQNNQSDPWLQRTIDLSAYQGDTFKLVFAGSIGNSLALVNMAIDDVEIIDGVCSDPSNLSAGNISFTSAELYWVSVSAHSTIEYGPAGFSPGTGTLVRNVTPGFLLSGLQAFTSYDFYVQDSCRITKSSWAGPYNFTTTCSIPMASFVHQGPSLNLSFDASGSSGIGLNYSWDFGDGNTGTGQNTSHTYSSSGAYNVRLVITDTCGGADTLIQNIQVCELPMAVILHNRTGLSVNFDGTTSAGASQYYWDLGPAGTFNTSNPTGVFPAKGTYPIYLVVTNACGSMDTSFMNLLICDRPTASFTAVITSLINPAMIVDFDGTASVFADSFIWHFGDGNSNNTSLTPRHVYPTSSLNYEVTLIATADCGLSDTLSYRLSKISLKESENQVLSVYPNPANSKVILSTSDHKLAYADLKWFDVSGKELRVPLLSVEEGKFEFDVSGLAAGDYFLVNTSTSGGAVQITIR